MDSWLYDTAQGYCDKPPEKPSMGLIHTKFEFEVVDKHGRFMELGLMKTCDSCPGQSY